MLPQAPTDNLYKFMAIFGLIGVIFSITANISLNDSMDERIFKFKSLDLKTGLEIERLHRRQMRTDTLIDVVEKLDEKTITPLKNDLVKLENQLITNKDLWNDKAYLDKKGKLEDKIKHYQSKFDLKISEARNSIDKNREMTQNNKELIKVREVEFEQLRKFENRFTWYNWSLLVIFALSMFIMLRGFHLWYFKLQVYLDDDLSKVSDKPVKVNKP